MASIVFVIIFCCRLNFFFKRLLFFSFFVKVVHRLNHTYGGTCNNIRSSSETYERQRLSRNGKIPHRHTHVYECLHENQQAYACHQQGSESCPAAVRYNHASDEERNVQEQYEQGNQQPHFLHYHGIYEVGVGFAQETALYGTSDSVSKNAAGSDSHFGLIGLREGIVIGIQPVGDTGNPC